MKNSDTTARKSSFYDRVRNSPLFQRGMRTTQFLSSVISLGLFSARLSRILATASKATRAQGAVQGILSAATLYTLLLMIYKLVKKNRPSNWLRWLLVVLDLCFVGAFIAVSYLTRSNGPAGPCPRRSFTPAVPRGQNCDLPWGTFVLAILSTLLHAITATFHEARNHHIRNKNMHEETGMHHSDDYSRTKDSHGSRY